MIATAILDRVLHQAVTVNIRGNAYRLKDKPEAGLVQADEPEAVLTCGCGRLDAHRWEGSGGLDSRPTARASRE